jgi:molybdate transport system regulatory protein
MAKFSSKKLEPRIKLWLHSENSQDSFGDGKWRLLETIEKTESLKSTCELLGISYRKAWGNLKKAEECLNLPLVTKARGGKTHGHTNLTEEGKAWMQAYSKFRQDIEKAVNTAYTKHIRGLVE